MDSIDTKQNATPVRLVGNDSTGAETNFVESTAAGGLHTNIRNSTGGELLGRQLPSNSIPVVKARAPTYSVGIAALVSAASATDIFTITGSATKTIRITHVRIGGNSTTSTWHTFLGIKRSTANTSGTFTTLTGVSYDSLNATSTAVVRAYTANPTLGTTVGTLRAQRLNMPINIPTNAQGNGPGFPIIWDFGLEQRPVILRGVNEVFAINLNAVTVVGPSISIFIEWEEE